MFVKYDGTDATKHLPFITTLHVLRPTRFDVCVGVVVLRSTNIGYMSHVAAWYILLGMFTHTYSIYTVLYLHYLAVNFMWYIGNMLICI